MEFSPSNITTNQERSTPLSSLEQIPQLKHESGVMRGRRMFSRLVGAAALSAAALAPAQAESFGRNVEIGLKGVAAASVVAGVNKSFGAPVITFGMNQQGEIRTGVNPQGVVDAVNNAQRKEALRQQQIALQNQMDQRRQQIMQRPTVKSEDVIMSNFFKSKDIQFKEGQLDGKRGWFLYEPLSLGADNNQGNGFFFNAIGLDGNPVKYTSVHFSYKDGNVFTATLTHTNIGTLQTSSGSVDIEYNPQYKSFHPASKR